MQKLRKRMCAAGMTLAISFGLITNAYGESFWGKTGEEYTDSMQKMLAGLVPEEGLTIKGRNYDYWDVITFLDEVRWAPDDYVHKDHHCVLSDLPEEEVKSIVRFLRFLMDCPTTYTDYETVAKVQERLNEEGYDSGEVDGILGENTYAALRAYQQEHDLRLINAIADDLLEEMEFDPVK